MADRYRYEQFGHNWRMTDLAAAMGLAQLPGYTEVVDARARHAEQFNAGLRTVEQLHLPQRLDGRRHVWHQFTIRVTGVKRDRFVERLALHRVGCAVHYPVLLIDLPHIAAVAAKGDSVPEARRCAAEVVSLPVHQHLSDDDVGRVVRAACDGARPCTE
jgi:dTDP-4-amino-4,6-dideoxygalactose transaminase